MQLLIIGAVLVLIVALSTWIFDGLYIFEDSKENLYQTIRENNIKMEKINSENNDLRTKTDELDKEINELNKKYDYINNKVDNILIKKIK